MKASFMCRETSADLSSILMSLTVSRVLILLIASSFPRGHCAASFGNQLGDDHKAPVCVGVFAGGECQQFVAVLGSKTGIIGAARHALCDIRLKLRLVPSGELVVAEGLVVGVKAERRNHLILAQTIDGIK